MKICIFGQKTTDANLFGDSQAQESPLTTEICCLVQVPLDDFNLKKVH